MLDSRLNSAIQTELNQCNNSPDNMDVHCVPHLNSQCFTFYLSRYFVYIFYTVLKKCHYLILNISASLVYVLPFH